MFCMLVFFFFKQKTAYELRISDWSSDVCSSDLHYGLPQWYGDTGLMLTTQFFALKIQRYMHDHGISARTLARVASKAFENGSRTPHAWRRAAMDQGAILASRMLSDPLTQYMFCSPSAEIGKASCRENGCEYV